jgi:hypothetical protein
VHATTITSGESAATIVFLDKAVRHLIVVSRGLGPTHKTRNRVETAHPGDPAIAEYDLVLHGELRQIRIPVTLK